MSREGNIEDSSHQPNPRKKALQENQDSSETETEADTEATSSAAKKLKLANDDFVVTRTHGYRIIEVFTVFGALSQMLICKQCKGDINLAETGNRGLGFIIAVNCSCGVRKIHSGPFVNNAFEINRRITFVMRLLGVYREGINLFCGLMDMCQGLGNTVYYAAVENIHTSTSAVFRTLSRKAVEEEKEQNTQKEKPLQNFTVSGDGTWKKRGFSSLFGVTTLIGQNTGKVIDLVVKSTYCHSCNRWKNKTDTLEYLDWFEAHEETCAVNYPASAEDMEVDSMKEMFSRSEKFGVKYTNYVGDGDSKTFKAILELKPYSEDVILEKSECVEQIQKRMGARLRDVKKLQKLGGKKKLTEVLIKKLTKYYGLAIRKHPDSVNEMKKAVMATYYHMCSTDENPQHQYCPVGAESWCKWRVAEATEKLEVFKHEPAFSKDVQDHLLPIYEDLSRDYLLERCLDGCTQNPNRNFNLIVWRLAPKHLHCGLQSVEIATYLAAAIFNEGYYAILKIMEALGIVIGPQCKIFADTHSEKRSIRIDRRYEKNKETRTIRKIEKPTHQDLFKEEEGLLYDSGIGK